MRWLLGFKKSMSSKKRWLFANCSYFVSCIMKKHYFYHGGKKRPSKNVDHMVGQRQKKLKITLAKTPKNSPKKRNLYQKINYSKPHIWSLTINFRFSGGKSQIQQKPTKKITHFTMQIHLKNLTYFTNLNSRSIIKNIHQQHSKKICLLYKFSSMVRVRKNTALHHL